MNKLFNMSCIKLFALVTILFNANVNASEAVIKLNFINRSNDANNSKIVIFQKNHAAAFDETVVAWKVIENCGPLDSHPFKFPLQFEVAASDSWGNYTPSMKAYYGESYEMVKSSSGDELQLSTTPATSLKEVEIKNNLQQGVINANIFRDGKLLAVKSNIVPGQKATFEFQPSIYIGVAEQVIEGQIMETSTTSTIHTQMSLLGLASADIVMYGGGPNGEKFYFQFENIRYQ